jgi:hypothetical protein
MRIFSSPEKCRRSRAECPDRVFRRLLFRPGFLSLSSLLAATMIQKSFLPENLRSVSMVLTPDTTAKANGQVANHHHP